MVINITNFLTILAAICIVEMTIVRILNNRISQISYIPLLPTAGELDQILEKGFYRKPTEYNIVATFNINQAQNNHKGYFVRDLLPTHFLEIDTRRPPQLPPNMHELIQVMFRPTNTKYYSVVPKKYPSVVLDGLPEDPKYLFRLKFYYPPFILSAPLNTPINMINSSFFRSRVKNKALCGDNVCLYPQLYMTHYHSNPCLLVDCDNLRNLQIYNTKLYTNGKIDVIDDGEVTDDFVCGREGNLRNLKHLIDGKPEHPTALYFKGKVVYMVVPEGRLFHHFMDRILPKLVQLESYIADPSIYFYIDINSKDANTAMILELINRIGISDDRLIIATQINIRAETLILSCKTPPIHPYLFQRLQTLLKLPYLNSKYKSKKRNIIVYMSRNYGNFKGGRHVLNEEIFLHFLNKTLHKTNYTLYIYDTIYFDSLKDLLIFWSKVYVVIGPHGPTLYYMTFAPYGTNIIEFMSNEDTFYKKPAHFTNYINAELLGHNYYALPCEIQGDEYDMVVSLSHIKGILDSILNS